MATGTEKGVQAAHGPAACYWELSRFPAVTRATLRAAAGGQTFLLYTECSRPDPAGRRLLRFDRHYSLRRTAGREGLTASRTALSAEIHNQLLSQDSPTGQRRAVLKRCPRQGRQLLEVWDCGGCSHSVDLTALGKHGDVYTEGPFACLAWSHSETRLLYVAEKSRPKRQPPCPWDVPGAAWPAAEDEDEEFVYHEDWGEALSTHSVPVLCVLDLEGLNLSVLEGVPEHLSPGQALWSPDDHGVVFVGWWNKPFRLGLNACSNRRSGIFHLDLASGCCGSPEGCWELLTLQWDLLVATCSAPHHPPSLVSTVWHSGIWHSNVWPGTARCGTHAMVWCSIERHSVVWNSQIQCDTALAWHSLGMAQPPCHPFIACAQVVAVLPPAGQELPLAWVPVEDTPTVPGVTWKTLMVQPPCSGQGPTAPNTQAFEALLLTPSDGTPPHPLIVCPHGGPHAVFDARWRPSMAALCQLGFAVLLVNYRGSLGFGQASISSLLSRVGEQDVADTQLAVEQALQREPLDPHRLGLLAGSHGAFIALHLLTREPELYQACALRSPVSNLPALLGTSDIPDWRYTSLGLPYSFDRVPRAEEVATMLLRSPISQAAQVRQGQDGCGVPGVGCQTPTEGSAAGADTGVAVCGRSGPARQPHTGAGAVPGVAGQGCASTAPVVPRGWPCTGWCGDRGQCLQELCPLVSPAPGAAQTGWDRPTQPLVPTVVLGYACPRVTAGSGDDTWTRGRWSEHSQGQGCGLGLGVK
ncbi:acylamino-acid-releasing enzyme-like isoform X5 [Chamaea fasciata]|uniref:acylamino-acid-releasing enzyme-like isoform X5 n=1 Tax=Chamaea fasciata TaxID=190680 RepID=UPI00336A2875